jgi:hypothetical protein
MSHPFIVGKTYRNRVGEYVVQDIEGGRMTIRYSDGRTLATSVQIQARIWENIQFERQMEQAEEKKRQAMEARKARQRAARIARTKPTFDGFQESDFEPKKRGLSWSSRKELGRVLAYELAQRTKGTFGHWIVPRQSKIHVGRKEQYDRDTRDTNAAFSVAVGEDGVSFGFQVGKPGGKAKADWPWSVLMAALMAAKPVRGALHSAMKSHDLTLDIYAMDVSYGPVAQVTAEGKAFLWQQEDAEQEMSRSMSGEDLAEQMRTLAPDRRSDLYVRKQISPKAAAKAGPGVAQEIANVLEALLPVYDASAR